MKKIIAKISESKSWFLEKILKKIDKLLANFAKKKRETQIHDIRNEKGEITMDTAYIQRIIRDYYKQFLLTRSRRNGQILGKIQASKTEPGRKRK